MSMENENTSIEGYKKSTKKMKLFLIALF